MGEVIPPFGRALLDVLLNLPGGGEEIERDFVAHASRPLPVVTVVGAYDSGKSSLIKRALVDDGRDVPPWLTVSARRETFEVRESEAFGCTLRDTPGISAGNAEHDQLALEALALSDAIVVAVSPQLLTSERDAVLDILSGRVFTPRGTAFPPSGLHVVVSRMNEAGIDPLDDPDGYAKLAERKLEELREVIRRGGVDPSTIRFHAVCADPFGRTGRIAQPTHGDFDEARAWDGVAGLEEALSEMPASLPALRVGASERYFALAAMKARSLVDDELERQQLALDTCQSDLERLALLEKQLDALSISARLSLEGLVEEEIQSAARMHGLSLADITREAEQTLRKALERWHDQNDAAISKLAREAGEEIAARRESPGRRSLDDVLAQGGRADERTEKGVVDGLRRFGPHLVAAVRSLHEMALGMSLEEARSELARIDALGGFEQYLKATGRRRLVHDTAQAEDLDLAVTLHGAIAAVGPILLEFAALYSDDQRERRVAAERAQRLEELRARIDEAARSIAASEWRHWEQRVAAFRASLDERRRPAARLEAQLAEVFDRLERVQSRLETLNKEWPVARVAPPDSKRHSSASATVHFLLITALEEERDALLAKLHGVRKLDRDGAGAHTYYEAEVSTLRKDKACYRVVVSSLSGMGPIKAAIKASAVIQRWNPQYVLMIGIGGGIEGEVQLGDVMVASQVVDYTLGKVRDDRPREERWQVHRADADLLDAVTNFPTTWEDLIVRERPDSAVSARRIGIIASGGDVIDSKAQIAIYREDWPKLIGVEMEGGGMAEALHDDIKRPRFLMIRGVSDLANADHNAETKKVWRAYACHVAAAYAVGLLRDGPVKAPTHSTSSRP